MNKKVDMDARNISDISKVAKDLHRDLFIVDWHADTLMWPRDINTLSSHGHVDLPRLQTGNVATQIFTAVTKSPSDFNLDRTSSDSDQLTLLFAAQAWPFKTWFSLHDRALYMAEKLKKSTLQSKGNMHLITDSFQFSTFLRHRFHQHQKGAKMLPVAALLGVEGLHAAEGDIAKLDILIDRGFRVFGLTHFFDNSVGGSLHGETKTGLTDFGRQIVRRLEDKSMIIDLAHASKAVVLDVLNMVQRPVIISHTGFKGHHNSTRNLPDELMKAVAKKGGLIAVGFWPDAVGSSDPDAIASSIAYGVNLVGEDHIALGSDWDGAVTAIAADDLIFLTESLLKKGLNESQIRKVMGDNARQFLLKALPKNSQ